MSDISSFNEQLLVALDEKTEWFDTQKLPGMLENYRLLHTCIKNLYEMLVKKSRITPDPYKHEKKISEVVTPDDGPFADNERSIVIGTRFSDYESMLDFICTYFKFSVAHITMDRIKSLVQLNNCFLWHDFTPNSAKPNTRGLAELVFATRQESDPMTASTINDSISKCAKAISDINAVLKELTEFQKEVYKGTLRKDLFEHPNFSKEKAELSAQEEMQQIRRLYPAVMGKAPFYSALVEELVEEDHAPDKDARRQALLDKLHVHEQHSVKKVEKVDTKAMLMEAVHALTLLVPLLDQVTEKVRENHDIIEDQHNTFWDKFKKMLRKAFNIPEPPVDYQVYITDPLTQTEHMERISYNDFMSALIKRSRFYSSFSVKISPAYHKIESSKPEEIIDFLNRQISECQKLHTQLAALDDFFKNALPAAAEQHVKGMKMELTTMKNSIVKANQRRAEYTSYIEEEAQMKKLGIQDTDE